MNTSDNTCAAIRAFLWQGIDCEVPVGRDDREQKELRRTRRERTHQ
jgi:hypothetical protein